MKYLTTAVTLLLLLTAAKGFSQNGDTYTEWTRKAMAFYDAKQYRQSADAFTQAFASRGGKGFSNDRYNAACSWAMAGNADSAFENLMRIAVVAGYSDLSHLMIDTDLESLHTDKRWNELVRIVKENKERAEAHLNKPLVALLDSVFEKDQGGRMEIGKVEQQNGRNSKEMTALWARINKNDSENLVQIIGVLDQYGWPGPEEVGSKGSQTVFLVIQHADIQTQKKYLPVMREAVKQKKAQASSLALLEDRVALREGRKQIYGSQIGITPDGHYYVDALDDPEHVDERRAKVGLGPLGDYVQHWGLTWDAEAYKRQLPEIEKRNKENSQTK